MMSLVDEGDLDFDEKEGQRTCTFGRSWLLLGSFHYHFYTLGLQIAMVGSSGVQQFVT